jgi:hypothetical protein
VDLSDDIVLDSGGRRFIYRVAGIGIAQGRVLLQIFLDWTHALITSLPCSS